MGRPPRDDAVRARALERIRALLAHDPSQSARAVHRALLGEVSRGLVLALWKELRDERARTLRREREQWSRHSQVLARDTLWALDGTHLGRDLDGTAVIAELVRDVGSTLTLGTSIGGSPSAKEIIRLLRRLRRAGGVLPLVLVLDNGPENRGLLKRWCQSNQVILLYNLPHTPQHNPCAEHGNGELKRISGLGKGTRIDSLVLANATMLVALQHIDGVRRRPTRGMRTAREAYAALPPALARIDRPRFYESTDCAMRAAVESSTSERQGRLAAREVVLQALERNGLVTRTRGRGPLLRAIAEGVS